MSTKDFDPKAVFEICRKRLEPRELSEVGTAAIEYPQALTRAISFHAGVEFTHEGFAQMLLRVARDVNQRKGIAS